MPEPVVHDLICMLCGELSRGPVGSVCRSTSGTCTSTCWSPGSVNG